MSAQSSPSTNGTSFLEYICDSEKVPKVGSLQVYVPGEGSIENFSPNLFETDEVHKIAVLDLRLLNLDRNGGNILVQNSTDPITKV